jgi:hypothetical protein
MTLPASGSISFNDINIELGNSSTQTISLNDSGVRTLFGVSSGSISMNVGYGKSNRAVINYIISSSTQELSLTPSSFTGYIAGKSDITITVNSGIYVWSNNTSNPGLIVNGGLSSGDTLKLVNNGYIIGKGGAGSRQGYYAAAPGFSGGNALKLLTNITIDNYSYIAGGGGGGGGGTYPYIDSFTSGGGGGGAGGGNGGQGGGPDGYPASRNNYLYFAGTGGSIGNSGTNGGQNPSGGNQTAGGGGGGGRILPGIGGGGGYAGVGGQGGGAGGGGGGASTYGNGFNGGAGGSSNNAGGVPSLNFVPGGGGGGWGASGGRGASGYSNPGGSGGKAIDLNGYSVTYINQGTVWGAVS